MSRSTPIQGLLRRGIRTVSTADDEYGEREQRDQAMLMRTGRLSAGPVAPS
jgi:hypothetical protein